MALWTGKEAQAATGGELVGKWSVDGVSIDSREIKSGDLFVALSDQRDGHDFVGAALAAGAGAALVSHRPEGIAQDAPLLIVPDVLKALEDLASAARARTKAKVIGVTGSAGKTSTKEMLRNLLARQGKTHAAERSFNNHWGVPLTLARMPAKCDFAVIEIGMNQPGEIAPLAELARPHVVMITNVAAAHLEAFEDIAGIAREKASIAKGLEQGGHVVACAEVDNAAFEVLNECLHGDFDVTWYGMSDGLDWHIDQVSTHADCSVVHATLGADRHIVYKIAVPGDHFALNGLGALAAIEAAGADAVVAAHDLVEWEPPEGRGKREMVVLDFVRDELAFELIDDAFNANPASMTASLAVLAQAKPVDGIGRVSRGRRIAILGDMLELGEDELELHRAIAALKATKKLDVIHTVGPRMKALHEALKPKRRGKHFEDAKTAAAAAHHVIDAGDIVLVKGSKGSKVSLVVDALRKLGHPRAEEE